MIAKWRFGSKPGSGAVLKAEPQRRSPRRRRRFARVLREPLQNSCEAVWVQIGMGYRECHSGSLGRKATKIDA